MDIVEGRDCFISYHGIVSHMVGVVEDAKKDASNMFVGYICQTVL